MTFKKGEMLSEMLHIATNAHHGQFDKGGNPYILHPLALLNMAGAKDEEFNCILVGHDVIEDGKIDGERVTYQYLRDRGMTERVIDGIRCMTKVPGETAEEYEQKVMSNKDSIMAKMYDLRHNSDITRLKGVTEKDFSRMAKYHVFYLKLKTLVETKE